MDAIAWNPLAGGQREIDALVRPSILIVVLYVYHRACGVPDWSESILRRRPNKIAAKPVHRRALLAWDLRKVNKDLQLVAVLLLAGWLRAAAGWQAGWLAGWRAGCRGPILPVEAPTEEAAVGERAAGRGRRRRRRHNRWNMSTIIRLFLRHLC